MFTAQTEAKERSAALGAKVHSIEGLRERHVAGYAPIAAPIAADVIPRRVRRRVKTVERKHREAG